MPGKIKRQNLLIEEKCWRYYTRNKSEYLGYGIIDKINRTSHFAKG